MNSKYKERMKRLLRMKEINESEYKSFVNESKKLKNRIKYSLEKKHYEQ